MRKVTTLLGLTLVALASTARAQEAAPVAVSPAPPAAAPLDTNTASAAPPVVAHRHFTVGLSLVPMALGRFISTPGSVREKTASSCSLGDKTGGAGDLERSRDPLLIEL